LDSDTISLIKNKKVYYIPTLQLEESFYAYAARPDWMDTPFFKNAESPELAQQLASPAYKSKVNSDKNTPVHRQAFRMAENNLKKLLDAGALIGFGTDSGAHPYRIQGFAEHRELELMVESGMTPLQAIQSATVVNANMLHIGEKTGTVEKGKQADLVVLNADPTTDVTNTRQIDLVFHNGKQVSGE
jgi:imidazolonepropionase-like amidohydrolase